jgi:membrane dipeptidase
MANDAKFLQRARELLTGFPLIDGHNDLPIQLRERYKNKINDQSSHNFQLGFNMETDLAKLSLGQVGGQFWSVYIHPLPPTGDWDDDQVIKKAVLDTFTN